MDVAAGRCYALPFGEFIDLTAWCSRRLADCQFAFANRRFGLRTDDPGFRDRFVRRFDECSAASEPPSCDEAIWLDAITTSSSQVVAARIAETGSGCSLDSLLSLLHPELRLVDSSLPTDTWHRYAKLGRDASEICVATQGPWIVLDRGLPWQMVLTRIFLTHLMRLQPELVFLHGATLALGSRGVLLMGERGAGKSTLSLALASRGHGFLGDEVAAVDAMTRVLHPFRMQVSVREGPQDRAVAAFLRKEQIGAERYLDGTSRYRARVGSMFPVSKPRQVALTDAFFLRPVRIRPRVESFRFSTKELHMVSPLHGTLAAAGSLAARLMSFLKLFGSIRCHFLFPGGTPEDTAALIEGVVEGAG